MLRLGQVTVNGTIGNATLAASGAGDVYIIGLEDTAVLNLGGTVTATIVPAYGEFAHTLLKLRRPLEKPGVDLVVWWFIRFSKDCFLLEGLTAHKLFAIVRAVSSVLS